MIGEKIRKFRLEKNLSLKALADKTGLTSSFLSQVERDIADPSINSLRKVADALEVPIFSLLVSEVEPNPVVRKNERKSLRFAKSQMSYELLTPDLNRSMEVLISRLEPGGSSSTMTHIGEECSLVLEGTLEITIANVTYLLDEGDSIYLQGEVPHRMVNVGDKELVLLSCITPPRF
ncbi:cupin domain-containing protein [Paradesulfitobacterium ferrireducens]|uniref:cupin domain-containing protein n=1 Tax=Paradesulfitobacterium ferrireducens TaxID=2816476 RepID=UPI001A8DDEEA|nr:cupin domain-containing protein [Paradesulfitobacterium ferrireducens]